MQLIAGSDALKAEIQGIIGNSLNDPRTVDYVSQLLLSPVLSGIQEIQLNWIGLHYSEFPEQRLEHSREMGDRCFLLGVFYLDDLERQGQYQIVDLGRSGYNVAALYANNLHREEEGETFSLLSKEFLPAVADISYNFGKRMGNSDPPQRIVVWTPLGERLVLSRTY